jgi:hypothetical protein
MKERPSQVIISWKAASFFVFTIDRIVKISLIRLVAVLIHTWVIVEETFKPRGVVPIKRI